MRGRRRLLDRLQQPPGADGVEQVELVEDEHLAIALDGREGSLADDLGGLLGGDRRSDAHDLAHVGVLAGQRQPGVTGAGRLGAGQQQGGEGTCRFVLGRARWSDEQVGVNRRRGSPTQRGHGPILTDDVGPDRGGVRRGRHVR